MNRRTWIWALGALIACMGLVTDSQAALLPGFHATLGPVAVAGGTVQVDYAVFTKNGDGTYTGNGTVDGAFAGGGDYLYLYQVTSNVPTITQSLTKVINPVDSGPFGVNNLALNGAAGTFAAATTNTTLFLQMVGTSMQHISFGANTKAAIIGYTSNNPPKIAGTLSAQVDADGDSAVFDVPVPDPALAPSVPEPGTLLMSALALIGGGYAMRRRVVVA